MTEHKPTDEQTQALDLFATGESLTIEAGAGTGKTSTLTMMADQARRTQRRGQYVAFNAAIVAEAKTKMPRNMGVATAHSLAFRDIGRNYAHRLNSSRMRSDAIARRLGIGPLNIPDGDRPRRLSPGWLAGWTMRMVRRYCQSARAEITERDLPTVPTMDVDQQFMLARELLPFAQKAWSDLTDPNGELPFGHEHYLKMWQLSEPRLVTDFVLFDEAQDASPVMLDVITRQTHAQLVYVGDSQQQIYSFTGAHNALQKVDTEHTAFLTRSFRFGPAIASTANYVLALLDAPLRLTGDPEINSRVERVPSPDCVLCRTNATALAAVLTALSAGLRVALMGGADDIIAFARAAQQLQAGKTTWHRDLGCFTSWTEVLDYVASDPLGDELALMVRLVHSHGPDAILAALDQTVDDRRADLIVSTAHKAKGCEWVAVRLEGDFPGVDSTRPFPEEELRLLYVAATRAKIALDVTAVPIFGGAGVQLPMLPTTTTS